MIAAPSGRTRACIGAVIVLQVLVPMVVLAMTVGGAWPRPARAGWQMFSSRGTELTVVIELEDGQLVEEEDWTQRRDVHLTEARLARLCVAEPLAVAVRAIDGRVAVRCR